MPLDPIREALSMPWSGERNLALRSALGLVEGEIGMVNQGDVVQLVVDSHGRASELSSRMRRSLPGGWKIRTRARDDRRYLVSCYADDDALAQGEADLDMIRRLVR